MQRVWPQAIIMGTGALLVLAGIVAIGIQILYGGDPTVQRQQQQQMSMSESQIDVKTHFVGIELIAIGAMLEVIGFVAARPWKGDAASPKS